MPVPRGAGPEHNMRQALILFMKENIEKVEQIAEPFLSKKKLTLDAYIAFMEKPGHWGDELALHLLAVMNQIYYCIIMKTKVFYSHLTVFSGTLLHSPRSAHHHLTLISTDPSPKILHLELLTTKTGRSRNDSNRSPSLSLSMPRIWTRKWKSMPRNLNPLHPERRGLDVKKTIPNQGM